MNTKEANVRALSWKDPFAILMLAGKIETRSWYTKYRGEVLICTTQARFSEMQLIGICGERLAQEALITRNKTAGRFNLQDTNGMAIAVGTLVECRNMMPEDEEKCFVKFDSSLKCHVYENVRPIEPFPFKGQQGWKKLDQETIDKIKFK